MKGRNFTIFTLGLLTIATLGLIVYTWWITRAPSIVIEWSTASELDTVGFNIYRSDDPDGGTLKVNDQLIPASADAYTGSDYTFTDQNVLAGKTYYYWLEDISGSGAVNRNGPIEAEADSGIKLEWVLILIMVLILGWGWWNVWRSRSVTPVEPL